MSIVKLGKSIGDNSEEVSNMDLFSLEMFENIAFMNDMFAEIRNDEPPDVYCYVAGQMEFDAF